MHLHGSSYGIAYTVFGNKRIGIGIYRCKSSKQPCALYHKCNAPVVRKLGIVGQSILFLYERQDQVDIQQSGLGHMRRIDNRLHVIRYKSRDTVFDAAV